MYSPRDNLYSALARHMPDLSGALKTIQIFSNTKRYDNVCNVLQKFNNHIGWGTQTLSVALKKTGVAVP